MFITPFDLGIGIVFFILSKWMIEQGQEGRVQVAQSLLESARTFRSVCQFKQCITYWLRLVSFIANRTPQRTCNRQTQVSNSAATNQVRGKPLTCRRLTAAS